MRSYLLFIGFFIANFACAQAKNKTQKADSLLKAEINLLVDKWHLCAAKADTLFFDMMSDDGVYIGTDKTEYWTRDEFKKWAKPFFLRKSAWDFKAIKRNIYFSSDKKTAWFDEQLDTWMGVCQSSGVLVKQGKLWKISHYQLSITLPNDLTKNFIKMVQEFEAK